MGWFYRGFRASKPKIGQLYFHLYYSDDDIVFIYSKVDSKNSTIAGSIRHNHVSPSLTSLRIKMVLL